MITVIEAGMILFVISAHLLLPISSEGNFGNDRLVCFRWRCFFNQILLLVVSSTRAMSSHQSYDIHNMVSVLQKGWSWFAFIYWGLCTYHLVLLKYEFSFKHQLFFFLFLFFGQRYKWKIIERKKNNGIQTNFTLYFLSFFLPFVTSSIRNIKWKRDLSALRSMRSSVTVHHRNPLRNKVRQVSPPAPPPFLFSTTPRSHSFSFVLYDTRSLIPPFYTCVSWHIPALFVAHFSATNNICGGVPRRRISSAWPLRFG